MDIQTTREFERLRADFEREASRYAGLKFSVIMVTPGMTGRLYEKPNHAITLWQYLGRFDTGRRLPSLETNDWGMPAAKITATGLLEGADTDLFCRMAARGGSLLTESVHIDLLADLETAFADDEPGKPLHVVNGEPLAKWLTFLIASMWRNQQGRMKSGTMAVDPFAASVSAIEYLLAPTPAPAAAAPKLSGDRRFDIALSFPGEKRPYVLQVATALRGVKVSVFYDEYFTAELARPDLDVYLEQIYHDDSDLLVVFLCEYYEKKEWCGLEWRALKDLIKRRQGHRIMLLRFDDAAISGLFSIDGYVDLGSRTPGETADLILERLVILRGAAKTPTA